MNGPQRRLFIALTIFVAATRWWAMSSSIWDWDEALFSSAVQSFDVVAHHPHPPGFPLYVLFGKIFDFFVGNEFRALQTINFIGASLLFPATFFLAREIGFSFATSIGGALLAVFAPNIWFYGGTAFSDVPSLTLVIAGCALLLRSRSEERRAKSEERIGVAPPFSLLGNSFLWGALLLGVSAGIRPQNLLIGLAPFILASAAKIRARRWGVVIVGAALTVAIVTASYVGAGLASYSWEEYQRVLTQHREYIVRVDSFRSAERPPLRKLFDDFFIREFQFRRVSVGIFILSVISVADAFIRRRRPPLLLLATLGPFALLAWLVLDFISVSRFSIGYLPLFAILGADGLGAVAALARVPEARQEAAVGAGSALISLAMIVWAAPAIHEARSRVSPPVAAVQWIRMNLATATTKLYVSESLMPMAEYLLPDYQLTRVRDERAVPLRQSETVNAYVLAEGATAEPSGFNFLRSRNSRLWRIARKRYFEISIIPLARRAQFMEGWYEAENEGAETWRWMGRRSVTILPAQTPPAELRLTLMVPLDAVPVPTIRIIFNGQKLDEFRGEWMNSRAYIIQDSRADAPNELVIETSEWINPKERSLSGDARDLGLKLHDMTWGPARAGKKPSHRPNL